MPRSRRQPPSIPQGRAIVIGESMADLPADLAHGYTRGPRPRLHYVTVGSGQPVLLLHGFPDFWYGWRHQIGPLAAAGYRVVAPDQRGYHRSDKPRPVHSYRINALAGDVLRLADEVAPGQLLALVGHDWGAAVAWWIALHHPERLTRLVIINVPHPEVLLANLRRNPAQMRRSWYVAFFQLPWLPEWLLGRKGFWGLERVVRASSHASAFSDTDIARYREAWASPGALTSMLNWYRALIRYPPRPQHSRVTVPTLILWGAHDVALGRELAEPSCDLCDDGCLVFFEQASHWPHDEEPARVNSLLLRFLEGGTAAVVKDSIS
jgi:pimeloyl-ACP methyl ester carboxylesterase